MRSAGWKSRAKMRVTRTTKGLRCSNRRLKRQRPGKKAPATKAKFGLDLIDSGQPTNYG